MKINTELIQSCNQFINPIKERQLDLRGYKITAIENLGATLDFFDAIDLSDNEITKLVNFSLLKRLKTLLLSTNRISKIYNFSDSFPALENLVLTNNRIADLKELNNLENCNNLQRLSLVNNQVTQIKDYRIHVIALLPSLRFLDFQKITKQERELASKYREKQQLLKKDQAQTDESKREKIKIAIENAKSIEEINRLELLLKSSQLGMNIFEQKFNEIKAE